MPLPSPSVATELSFMNIHTDGVIQCVVFSISLLSLYSMFLTIKYFQSLSSNNFTLLSDCPAAKSCPTLCIPMDCSPPGSSVHGTKGYSPWGCKESDMTEKTEHACTAPAENLVNSLHVHACVC